ncbi:hypothetical protein [Pseudomonas sp. NS1(2017)]|uniref:hypothetical protein n=1 Tax=Pseudomonas sp. NS1(2017) TaxID=2025658 RepID=UPI0012FD8CEA|nr:hypothetical protein [Pseudomonas sp. NS1(2017)]
MPSIDNVSSASAPSGQSNSLDHITDFGGEQVDQMPEHTRVKRPDAESAEVAGQGQITY